MGFLSLGRYFHCTGGMLEEAGAPGRCLGQRAFSTAPF